MTNELIIHNLTQGSPDWHAHRRNYFNASDACAMLGVSPYETRDQCLRRYKYGDTREVSPHLQRIFDQGHEFERLCRPLAEAHIGDDLMPVTGTRGNLSASLDGITMDSRIGWEHKTWSQSLAAAIESAPDYGSERIPEHVRAQVAHQHLVFAHDETLLSASKWSGEECDAQAHICLLADDDFAQRVADGWAQFALDLAAMPEAEEVNAAHLPVIGKSPDALPSLRIKIGGQVVITENNLTAYRDHVRHVLAASNTVPVTDQDFADADKQVKFCSQAENDIQSAIDQLLKDTGAVADAVKTMESLREEFRKHRLTRTKYIETRKDERNRELIAEASKELDRLRAEALAPVLAEWPLATKPNFMYPVQFAPQIKGLKTLVSKQNALMVFIRQIHADTRDAAAEALINVRAANAMGRHELWPDLESLVMRDFEAFAAILQQRVAKTVAKAKQAETVKPEIAKEIDRQVPSDCADMFGFQSDAEKFQEGLRVKARELVTELLDSVIRYDTNTNTVKVGLAEFDALLDFYGLRLNR